MSGELKAFLMSLILLAGSGWYLTANLPREWNHARKPCAESTVDGCYTEREGTVSAVAHEDDRWPVTVDVGGAPVVLRLKDEPPVKPGDTVAVRLVGAEPAGLLAGDRYLDARPGSRTIPIAIAAVIALIGLAGAFGTGRSLLRARMHRP